MAIFQVSYAVYQLGVVIDRYKDFIHMEKTKKEDAGTKRYRIKWQDETSNNLIDLKNLLKIIN